MDDLSDEEDELDEASELTDEFLRTFLPQRAMASSTLAAIAPSRPPPMNDDDDDEDDDSVVVDDRVNIDEAGPAATSKCGGSPR